MAIVPPSKDVVITTLNLVVEDIKACQVLKTRQAESQLARCRRRRNFLASAFLQLPDEIISEILLQTVAHPVLWGPYEFLCNTQLVCSRIHQVSNESPRLWRYIDRLGSAPHLLEKSRNVPLYISLVVGKHDLEDLPSLLAMLHAHIHRWETFVCIFRCRYSGPSKVYKVINSAIGPYTQTHAPLLRKFVIDVHPGIQSDRFDLLGGFSPRLQYLDITHITISWDSPILSGLTFLRITTWDGFSVPTSEQYLQVLLSCPELEQIHFIGRETDLAIDAQATPLSSPISLPNLKALHLKLLHPNIIHSLLSSIKANPVNLGVVFLGNIAGQGKETIESTLLGPSTSHFLSKFNTSLSTMVLTGCDTDERGITSVEAHTSESHGEQLRFECGFMDNTTHFTLYRTLFAPSVRTTVQTLDIKIDSITPDFDFGPTELLAELVNLKELRVSGYRTDLWTILIPLSRPTLSHLESISRGWLCPHLHRLIFDYIHFDIHELYVFLMSRYKNPDVVTKPTRLSHLEVTRNILYRSIGQVRMDFASMIANIVGRDKFVWGGYMLNPDTDEWISSM